MRTDRELNQGSTSLVGWSGGVSTALILWLRVASDRLADEATLRNLLRHQEKQLQEVLTERDELRRQTERQQQEIECQQKEIGELKRQQREEASAAPRTPREARQRPRKQVTIHLNDSDGENTWRNNQQQNQYQGGERGELHGRADGGDNAAETALQLSAIKAGNAEESLLGTSEDSPPAAGQPGLRRPIEMAWVDIQLRYEAFLLSLRLLPLSSMSARTSGQPQHRQRQRQQRSWDSEQGAASSSASVSAYRSFEASSKRRVKDLHWMDPSFVASLGEAVESAADAALPSFLVRCCRLAAAAASPSPQGKQSPPRANRTSRMSVQQVQDRILWSRRQQQQQQQEEASGRPPGPLDWEESDLQVLAYELLLLVAYHQSQYAAAAALLTDEEEALGPSSIGRVPESLREGPPQPDQQNQLQHAAAGLPGRQMRRPRKSLARAMSFKLGMTTGDEEQQHQHQLQFSEAPTEGDTARDTIGQLQPQNGTPGPTSRQMRKPRKSLARAMSFKLGVFQGDEDVHHHQVPEVLVAGHTAEDDRTAEGPSPDLLGPCHPFSLPLEEWRHRLLGKGSSRAPGPAVDVIPARQRLQAAQQWMSPSPLLQQSNQEVLLQLLQLARVSFELPSASSNKLLSLLTPLADSGLGLGGGSPTLLHPCDLRFRVCRLMEAWRVAFCPAAPASKAPPRKQQQQQQQRNPRFLQGAAAAAIGRFDATQGRRGVIRRRGGSQTGNGEKKGPLEMGRTSPASGMERQKTTPRGTPQSQQRQQQLAGDLGPPMLLQPTQEKRKSKRLSTAAAAAPPQPLASPDGLQRRQDPVFQSFVQRQLQLLHAAALSRCARLLKFLLPQGGAAGTAAGGAAVPVPSSLPWRPVQLQQLYARERSRSDEEAFLFFLRSLLLCQDETAHPKMAPQAPAFLLYSKEETAAAVAAAAQLQLLPLRLLCCFYHIFAYIFALQQLQKQQLWGDDEASVSIEEVSIRVTDYSGAPAGTGEAEGPLTWEVRTEQRERGGLQLLQLLQHSMCQAAALDSALRCTLAARGNNNPTLKRLDTVSASSGDGDTPSQQRLRRLESLKPVSNLLEVPDPRGDCGWETTDESDGKNELSYVSLQCQKGARFLLY